MMRIINYFIQNKSLNYVLLVFILFLGINAYQNIPKELFPEIALDKISIRGSYAGASADNLDKMAVRDIEDELGNIQGIDKIETVIKSGTFSIVLDLNDGADKTDALNKAKDAIARTRQYLPADMTEPTAEILTHNRPLIRLSLSSEHMNNGQLIETAKEVKSKISRNPFVSEVQIYGDADQEVSVQINEEAVRAYGLDPSAIIDAISKTSYIYPLGDIKQSGNYIFLSTVNGKSNKEEWESTLIKIGEKQVRLGDVAKVDITYPQDTTLSTFNGRKNVTLVISKGPEGNSMHISEELRTYAKEKLSKEFPEVYFDFYQDSSKPVKDRLNTVIGNLMFGLMLVFLSMALLINVRIASVVAMGIPISFAIGIMFLYFMGYSINIVSLLGGLIVIGIVVDDAIVVSENIQRHMNEGVAKKEAVFKGLKEMVLPVTLATLTTIAAFLPLFMLTGEIKNFIILIPITVIMILIGSLLESFFFLPLHAEEFLKKQKNFINWEPLQEKYEALLHLMIRFKYIFLFTFVVVIPVLTILTLKMLNFQFFPGFDGNYLYITGKSNVDTSIEETEKIAKELEQYVLLHKDTYALKSTSTVVGYRRALSGENENGDNMLYITMELYDMEPQSFIDAYVNPIFNFTFKFNDPEKIRKKHTYELAKELNKEIHPMIEKYHLEELGVREDKPGLIKNDIQINFSGKDGEKIAEAMKRIEEKLSAIPHVKNVSNNAQFGKMEYKLRINAYGEQLGLSEVGIAQTLSGYFLDSRKAMTFSQNGVMEIRTRSMDKDSEKTLMGFMIPTPYGSVVKLTDVVEIKKIRAYEKIEKRDGKTVKSVFANIDKKRTTAVDVLKEIKPLLQTIRDEGIEIDLLGENEKNQQFKNDMIRSLIIAVFLILITLLFIFPKIRYALMVMSVIPFTMLGALLGHMLIGINLSMPSVIGMLGLAGVVINDGIIMLDFLHGTHNADTFYERAKLRLRPILITSITTFLGLFTLIFYATGQAVILQPIAISIGFGLLWGTVLNLIYLPALYAVVNKIQPTRE
ncbi:MAG: efflux RND transporter permease subunit [Sulfurovum sp.]|uniref:efflux RND transporter permease subunit n=1 Tax=Sulfurovum sp. TaxID=1969726 RepID=UPI002867C4EF|nr:efflux RND transporter permease subunit [Sulfurovum sp.]MCO4844527.1 efflux RND transporter permease subunit [Sulfurovum sp.]